MARKNKGRRSKIGQAVRTPKSPEVKYRKTLVTGSKRMSKDTEVTISNILKTLEFEYVNDSYSNALESAFRDLKARYEVSEQDAKNLANSFVESVNITNRERFNRSVEKAIGVNVGAIVDDEGLGDILRSTVSSNVALIQSIPEEYFKKIESMVYAEVVQGSTANSMIQQIREIGHSTDKRAKLIARDQTAKLNSAISQQRQQNLGVTEYVWVTSEDDRVRASHKANDGKTFRWDDPPPTGHPGTEIQCRCIARPIIPPL